MAMNEEGAEVVVNKVVLCIIHDRHMNKTVTKKLSMHDK